MSNFSWIPFYKELSEIVLKDRKNDEKKYFNH